MDAPSTDIDYLQRWRPYAPLSVEKYMQKQFEVKVSHWMEVSQVRKALGKQATGKSKGSKDLRA